MSIDVSLFRPVVQIVRTHPDSGTIVVKIKPSNHDNETEQYGPELTLFFMRTNDGSPEAHVAAFIAALTHGAGFNYYEYDHDGVSVSTPTIVVEHEKFAEHPEEWPEYDADLVGQHSITS